MAKIGAGLRHSLAIGQDGTALSWGSNTQGQLGDGTTTDRHYPIPLTGLGTVRALAGGYYHNVALKADGTVWTWGDNTYGQLGDGTTTGRTSPVRVSGLEGMGVVSAGAYFSLAGPGVAQQTSTTYGYDSLYRLTGVSGSSSASYGYDPAGNRSTMGSTTYSYDRADRITAAGSTSYTVNADGNLVARGSDTFGYDQANRLKSASVGGTSSSYVYDGDGKRTSKTVGSTQTSYTYDVNASLPVLLDDGARKYVWGLGLAFAVDTSGNPLIYHTDGLGSIRALTDGSGSVVQTYQYDEYGVVVSSSGTVTQPFQYTREQQDGETGLVYLRARYYDPGSGRFLQQDIIGGLAGVPASLNRYAYVQGNPIIAGTRVVGRHRHHQYQRLEALVRTPFPELAASPLATAMSQTGRLP